MSDYTPVNDYSAKDALTTGNPLKLIKGSDVDAEFDAIAVAIATKYDSSKLASQVEAETGTDNTKLMTPLRVDQYFDAAITAYQDANAGAIGDIQTLTDPGADRILFWDDSGTVVDWLAVAPATAGIEISGTAMLLDIDSLTNVTPATGDELVVADASDSGLPKAVLLSELITFLQTNMNHDSLTGFVANEHINHTSVTLTAGAGLSGGGTIAASRSFAVDYDGQTEIDISGIAANDLVMLWDAGSSVFKKAQIQSLGSRIKTSATQTLALDDGNAVHVNASASTHTITVPPNSTVAFPIGTEIAFTCQSTGNILLAEGAGVSIVSLNSYKRVKDAGGGAYLIKTATNTWSLIGDLEA